MAAKLILIRHSGMRQVDEATVLESIPEQLRLAPREVVHVDTQKFADDVAVGEWASHDAYLRDRAAEIRRLADASEDPEIHYFGLAQIPHVIALGAALGDERRIVIHEYDRDHDTWRWPGGPEHKVVIDQPATTPIVTAPGIAVLRVSVSAIVQDADVRGVVGDETLADVAIRLDAETTTARVRSEAQLSTIRETFRVALAGIKNSRPNVETIHLFVAAPNSVCMVIGQELVPRNSPPVQTYVYRPGEGPNAYQAALLITAGPLEAASADLSDGERDLAARLRRELWTAALTQMKTYATEMRAARSAKGTEAGPWYLGLEPSLELERAAPFPSLPPIFGLVDLRDEIDQVPFYEPYGHDPEQHLWRLSDALVLGMYRAAGGDEAHLLPLIRLFFFHEYVHAYHSLTKYTATNVGKFANALERLDYTADTYAIFHELDLRHGTAGAEGSKPDAIIKAIADQVEQILQSFWAFDGEGPHREIQVRRVRRYLNWYWRLAQLRRAPTLQAAVALFSRSPAVELAGVRLRTDGERRIFFRLDSVPSQRPEVAVVLEDERLLRITESDSTSVHALIKAFRDANHSVLTAWFRPVFEVAKQMGSTFPSLHPLVQSTAGESR